MRLPASRYFTFALLAFIASFLLLPNTKAVNNVFYIFLALPALILILLGKAQRPPVNVLVGLWVGFFIWLVLGSLIAGSELRSFKYILYTLLFCAAVWLWVDWRSFDGALLFRLFFWGLIVYVIASAVFLWSTGQVGVGARVLLLPSRMEGPILTSMLIVSCFALLLPEWLRNRCWIEMTAALLAILFCAGFVLQSRSGLVGLGAVLGVMYGWAFWRGGWLLRSGSVLVVVLLVLVGVWLLQHSEVAARLISRADAGRFELWQLYFKAWSQCGFLLGCGAEFSPEIRIQSGQLIQHPHNIFLAIGFRYGVPGLLLFSLCMIATAQQAWKQKNPWGGYFLIALFMLNFDGRELINSPHEVWLLVLLPAMLIAAKQRYLSAPRAQRAD